MHMPPHLALLPGERVRWTGRPGRGLLFVWSDLFVVPFTFVWCAGASSVFWSGRRPLAEQPFPFLLIPFLFVGVGLFMAVGRFAFDMWLRARTSYVVTDRRVFIDRDLPFGRSIVLTLAQLQDVRLRRMRGGRGTIAFGDRPSILGNRGFGSMVPSLDPTPQLLMIDDATTVYTLIQRLANDAVRQPGQSAFS